MTYLTIRFACTYEEIGKIPLLSSEEELKTGAKIVANRDELEAIREQLTDEI